MDKVIHIAECQEPWIYWWELLTIDECKALKQKYFAESHPFWKASLLEPEIKIAWEQEKPDPLWDEDWLRLANESLQPLRRNIREREKEIWRQVYRIASDKI